MAVDSDSSCEPLIPGLPDEVAELCLLSVPYPYHHLLRSVSSSWNKTLTDPTFVAARNSLSPLPYLFVFAFHKPTSRIQWHALDPLSRRWFVLPPMPCPKAVCPPAFACASIPRQGKLFVLGGMRSDTETTMDTTLVYRASTNQWSCASPMPAARSFFAAGWAGGKIVVVGGSGDSVAAVDCYDPECDAWGRASKMRVVLARYESAVVGERVYVTEGLTLPFMFSRRGGVYDPDGDRWQEMSGGMKDGWTGVSVVLDDRLFVIQEYGDFPMKVYEPEEDTWRYLGGEKFPRGAMERPYVAHAVDGKIYVVSSGLNVAVGSVYERNKEWSLEWEVILAPQVLHDFCPSSCHLLYA